MTHTADRRVSRAALEEQLGRLRSQVGDPAAGLFGPASKLWQVNRESLLFLGGGRAALLQLAHPYVAAAIDQHSQARDDPFGRFHRTFATVFDMVFGDLETALHAARRLHAVHERIAGRLQESGGVYTGGDPYCANEAPALLWVHATLWDTSILVFERCVRRLTLEEKESYYQETKRFAHLFGLTDEELPEDWQRFDAYNREMLVSGRLAIGATARDIAAALFRPRPRLLVAPPLAWLEVLTAGFLPEPIRRGFELPFGSRERRFFAWSLQLVRATRRMWPRRLRHVPLYVAAQRRLAGKTGRDRVGELLSRLYVGRHRA